MEMNDIKKIEESYSAELRVFLTTREYIAIIITMLLGLGTITASQLEGTAYTTEYLEKVKPLYPFSQSPTFEETAKEMEVLLAELESLNIPWNERIPAIRALISVLGEELPEVLPDNEIEIVAQMHHYYFLLRELKIKELNDKTNLVVAALLIMSYLGIKLSHLKRRNVVLSKVLTELNYYLAIQGRTGTELQNALLGLMLDCHVGIYINEHGVYESSSMMVNDIGSVPVHKPEFEF